MKFRLPSFLFFSNFNRNILRLISIFLMIIILFGCDKPKPEHHFKIGFSQCFDNDLWRKTMLDEMQRELIFHPNITFLYRQAGSDSKVQIQQINDLLEQKIDLLIVSPNEILPLAPAIEKVYQKGIPVVLVDRTINSDKYTAFVGTSNFEVGQNAAKYAASILKGKGNILEITGKPEESPVIDRHKGFVSVLAKYPEMHLAEQVFDLPKSPVKAVLETKLKQYNNIDLIYAINDAMAQDAFFICKKMGLDKKIKIIGVDGLPMKGMGMDMVQNKTIISTVLYPTGGQSAIVTALKILEKKPFEKENLLTTTIIDSSNVRIMKQQSLKVADQQKEIEDRKLLIDKQIRITQNQNTVIFLILLLLFVSLAFGFVSFYYMKANKRIAAKLEKQNIEIENQKNQLVEMSEKAEVAHQAKLNFFTNISHEFRTPLTLILSPLEDLFANPKLSPVYKQTLQLVQKNVIRLYQLVNQLMDFRKIELNKMQLHVSSNDLVAFTKEIFDSFQTLSKNKNINFQFFTAENQLRVWFDVTMLDKVIFNLLSNAFKFTKENGFIYISISKEKDFALIKIEDNGIGMSADTIQHVFDPFFQGEYENYKGTGLGLALSKELIELHHGNIAVKSEKWKGTIFEIRLPLGEDKFTENDKAVIEEQNASSIIKDNAQIYISELYEKKYLSETEETINTKEEKKSLLLVEDNNDLRLYLKARLSDQYDVIDAANSTTALQLLFDYIPDIVICDVVIPGKNGLEITELIKNDIRTSHIPVILLTARSEENQKLQGLKVGADSYITKPFHFSFLDQTINSLLHNREKTKEHFTGNVLQEDKSIVSKKKERKFISVFSALVENNISNENFSVEDICNEMGISRVQLYRKVKEVLNCSVNEYIVNTRLQKAKYYLQHEDLSISEVAFKTGFSSATYFSTSFKSAFGISPKEFKQSKSNDR